MGTKKVITFLLLFLICFAFAACSANKTKTDDSYINDWVKKAYGVNAKAGITATMDSSLKDRTIYRGYIVNGTQRLEGLFFFNPLNKTVTFTEIN
jgi:hypothetical protein